MILLVGLGMQMFEWPASFVENLSTSHRVICVENRNAAPSPRCGPESEPGAADVSLREDVDEARKRAPYSAFDMRDDVLALLNKLGIDDFDIVGFRWAA